MSENKSLYVEVKCPVCNAAPGKICGTLQKQPFIHAVRDPTFKVT